MLDCTVTVATTQMWAKASRTRGGWQIGWSIAVSIFIDEQGTVPKDSNNFAEKRVRTSDPLDIQNLAPSPADKDLQIAVRAFFKMRFSYHRLFTSILAWLLSASF